MSSISETRHRGNDRFRPEDGTDPAGRFSDGIQYTTEPETTGKGGIGLVDGRDVGRKREFTWIDPGYKPTKDDQHYLEGSGGVLRLAEQ
jgi:hypothetical protein